jgi:GT2 family glycosyltransferase
MSNNKEKLGVGITTCNRFEYLTQCLESIDEAQIDSLVVVNDGKDLPDNLKKILQQKRAFYILNEKNLGVAKTKNKVLKYLLEQECDHIFALEDDCVITSNAVWSKYIEASKKTNIPHFNYGPGSPWNRVQDDPSIIGDLSKRQQAKQTGMPNPRLIVEYSASVKLALYQHIVAMFTYFHSSVLKEVGLMDETFYNAWEHVEHTYRIIKAGKYSPFWWFADIADSADYVKEAENEKANTSLARDEQTFMKQVHEGLAHFRKLHNTVPSEIPSLSKEDVLTVLKNLKQ